MGVARLDQALAEREHVRAELMTELGAVVAADDELVLARDTAVRERDEARTSRDDARAQLADLTAAYDDAEATLSRRSAERDEAHTIIARLESRVEAQASDHDEVVLDLGTARGRCRTART